MERKCLKNSSTWKMHTNSLCEQRNRLNKTCPDAEKSADTQIVVVLAWKLSSFQQLPREKAGICLKLQRTHPKTRSTPQAIPSLPSQHSPPSPVPPSCSSRGLCQGSPFPPPAPGVPRWSNPGGAEELRGCPGHAEPAGCFLTAQLRIIDAS